MKIQNPNYQTLTPPHAISGILVGARFNRSLTLSFCFLFLSMFWVQYSFAQTPGYWNGSTTVSTTTINDVGIGLAIPDGKTEIFIDCPAKNGLVITKDENCPLPYLDVPVGLNAEVVSPGTGSSEATFTVPFSFNVGSTLPWNVGSAPIQNNPLLWVRTKDINSSGGFYSSTRFVVLPDGKTGINVYNPRATLDVRNMSAGYNIPVAIFGVNEYTTSSGLPGNKQYKTRHVQIVPKCNENGYNQISRVDDLGMFFTDGKGLDGANSASGMVIAPWSESASATIGGIRIGADGNVEIHGTTRATKVKVNAAWWSDFVFAPEYKPMSLPELEVFINTNKHLPNIPTEKEVLENGIDVADIQALQLQKIEELTLYILDQQKQIDNQKAVSDRQQKQLADIIKKVESIPTTNK